MKRKRLNIIGYVVASLLLIPLVAMQLSDEVNWNLFDFVVATILLSGTGLIIDLVIRKVKGKKHRFVLSVGVLLVLVLIWAELAVGIFGTPLAGD